MPSVRPSLSVVIVTHNRQGLITKALDGLLAQTVPQDAFEVIVVDNASTDGTAARVGAYIRPGANVRYLFEEIVGISTARNAGCRDARAPYVAFLDDDAIPDPDWVASILRAFEEVTPRPACVGGGIEPIYEIPCPAWIRGSLLDHLSVVDHSPTPKFLADLLHTQKLASANMAVDRSALEAVGGWNTSLGRVGDHLLSGEDVLMQLQLEALGRPIYYDPRIRVRHHVAAGRLTPAWLSNRAYWGGVTDALLIFLLRGGTVWWAARTWFWGVRSLLLRPGLLRLTWSRGHDDLEQRCNAWHGVGFVMGGARALRLSLRRGRKSDPPPLRAPHTGVPEGRS
jgi:glycosyltransferase involved in cell wall biosynthesis